MVERVTGTQHASSAALQSRMWRAASWLLGSSMVSQGLRLVSSLVLTRLLKPEAFGLVATVQTVYLGLVMFSDLGVWQSVVKSEHSKDPRFLGTALSVQMLRGVLLGAVVLLIAAGLYFWRVGGGPNAASVYADERLSSMMCVFALVALVQGGESMKLAMAQRHLQAAALVRLELLSQFIGMLVTIVLALATRSVWSLLVGTVVSSLMRTVLSHTLLEGPFVRPVWSGPYARDIIGFGKWIFLSSLIGFAAAQGEKLLLGGLLTAATLGVYAIAATLLTAFSGLVSTLNAHLIFPGLSEALRSSQEQAEQVYSQTQRLADLVLGGVAGGLFFLGHWVVWLLYDHRYADAGWMLQWLAMGLLALRYQVLEQLMFARGQPSWVTASNALRALALVLGVPAGFAAGGEAGAVIAVVVAQFAGWPSALLFKWRAGLKIAATEWVWPLALLAGMALGYALDHGLLRLLPAGAAG